MYVWEVREDAKYDYDHSSILIKDDNEALSKIKHFVLRILREDLSEWEGRLSDCEDDVGYGSANYAKAADWVDSLVQKIHMVDRYEFISQFKKLETSDCYIYLNKVKVL